MEKRHEQWFPPERPALTAARAALRGREGPAYANDRPPVSTFSGRKEKPIPGQLQLDEEGEPMTTEIEPTTTELELYEPPTVPVTLFGRDPRLAVERMRDLSQVLVTIVRSQKLSVTINSREYLTAEAWSALGALVGVTPVVCWVHPNEADDGYVARVEARTLDGRVVGAAESECSRTEQRWKTRDSFQLRSMAQTRGISRALRSALAVIPVLAGYEAVSSEEMTDVVVEPEPNRASKVPDERRPSQEQGVLLRSVFHDLGELDPDEDWPAEALTLAGIPDWSYATGAIVADLIEKLETVRAKLFNEAAAARQEGARQ
jgi:hypothetical protein